MWLEPERLPDAVHSRLGQPDLPRHRASRPMCRVLRRGLQRRDDHLLDLPVGDRAWLPRPRLIGQPVEAILREPPTPLRRHVPMDTQLLGDLGAVQTLGRSQHDPRALRQRPRARARARPRHKLPTLLISQLNSNRRIWQTPRIPAAAELMHHDTSTGTASLRSPGARSTARLPWRARDLRWSRCRGDLRASRARGPHPAPATPRRSDRTPRGADPDRRTSPRCRSGVLPC